MLILKGDWTQRQFDVLGRLWGEIQQKCGNNDTYPAVQLAGGDGNVGIITFHANGEVSFASLFNKGIGHNNE